MIFWYNGKLVTYFVLGYIHLDYKNVIQTILLSFGINFCEFMNFSICRLQKNDYFAYR